MSQLGYQVLGTLARLLSAAKDNTGAADLWRPVFDLGPKGHQSIEHFMSCFFLNLTETTDVSVFVSKWRPMVNAALSGAGWTDRSWYYEQRLERHILGFGNSAALGRLVDHANLIAAMQDAYRSWAEKRLSENEDNIASFCNFLNTEVATTLRLDGLIWVAAALRAESGRPARAPRLYGLGIRRVPGYAGHGARRRDIELGRAPAGVARTCGGSRVTTIPRGAGPPRPGEEDFLTPASQQPICSHRLR